MTPQESDLMQDYAKNCRRHAILEGVVGVSLLNVAVLSALKGETWHSMLAGFLSGAFLVAAVFTYVRGRQWMTVAKKREG